MLAIQILGRTVFPFFGPKGSSDLIFGLLDHVLIFGLLLVPFFLGRSFELASRAETTPSETAARMRRHYRGGRAPDGDRSSAVGVAALAGRGSQQPRRAPLPNAHASRMPCSRIADLP